MRVLVAHLSDMHLKSPTDALLSRGAQVAAAINSRKEDASLVLIALTGDIAMAGKGEQYELARQFIGSLRDGITCESSVVMVPGNHDCDFDRDTSARELLIKALLHESPTSVDETVISTLVSVQQAFFDLRDSLNTEALYIPGKAFYQYRVLCDGGCSIGVRCVNTAWMSRLNESPGALYFPNALIPNVQEDDFSITLFHHPYNWLTPSSKAFIKTAEHTSDLILTGHEHDYDRSVKQKPDSGEVTSYIEGAALQEHGHGSESGFNVVLVDLEKELQRFYNFNWEGNCYVSQVGEAQWEPLALASQRLSGSLSFTDAFALWLNDPGIPNAGRENKARSLREFFVYPDLVESPGESAVRKPHTSIKSDRVFEAIENLELAVITGDPKSGRSALARMLILEFHSRGFVPIYYDTLNGIRPEPGMPQVLVVTAKQQYGQAAEETFRQLDRRQRVLILDNVDRSQGRLNSRRQVVENVSSLFGHIVLLGDDTAGKVTEPTLTADVNPDKRRVYRIRPLGFLLMERLARRWFSEDDDLGDEELSLRLDEAAKTLGIVLGRNYLPAYPLYVLAILRALEDGVNVNASVSTHGYFYELLIMSALTLNSDTKDISIRIRFLTHLAYEMFCAGRESLLEPDLKASFDRYQETFEVGGLRYEQLLATLLERGMLVRDADTIRFRYPYLFFFFVANQLRDLSTEEARNQVAALAKDLSDERSADIIMFLVHFSHDPLVLKEIAEAAESFFQSDLPATLDDLGKEESGADVPLEYVEMPQDEAREQAAARMDRQVAAAEQDAGKISVGVVDDTARAFVGALQTIRIVGQIIRNYPGSLEGDKKAFLANTSLSLGLRTLGAALRIIETGKESTIERVLSEVRRSYPNIPEDRLRERAEKYLRLLKTITAFGIIRTVSDSISARELEPTYRRVFEEKLSPAMELIHASVALEMGQGFPSGLIEQVWEAVERKYWPSFLLKVLVLEHFQRVFVDKKIQQRICAKLNIKYTPMLASATKQKALNK